MKTYFDTIHQGLPIEDVDIIDVHAHSGEYFNMHIPNASAEKMLVTMDRCGINQTIISTTIGICSDFVLGNTLMLETVQKYPDRFLGACLVNGHSPELSIQELERCFSENNAVVLIKIHPFLTKCGLNDERLAPVYHFAAKHAIPILVHTWLDEDNYGNLNLFEKVAGENSGINWIMGHAGGPYGSYRACQIAGQLQNVFLDITLSMCPARQIEYFVTEVGSERILFGTDNPFIDPRPQIGRVCLAEITQKDRQNIFNLNAKRLLKLK